MLATLCESSVRSSAGAPSNPKANRRLILQKYDRFEDVEHLREEWDELAESVGADLFASFDWCSTWWKHYRQNRRLEIYVAYRGDDLVGCVPLYRETLSYGPWQLFVVRVVGSGDAGTRCHLCIRADALDAVLQEISREVAENGAWDVFHIGDLPSNSCEGEAVARALGRGFSTSKVIFRSRYCPTSTYELPDSFDEYLNALSPKERSSIRRTHRRLKEDHGAEIIPTETEEVVEVFDHFLEQHADWWATKGQLGYFRSLPGMSGYHRDFCRLQARKGRLHLLRLKTRDTTIGYYYGHRFGDRIHAFSGARSCDSRWDALSPGKQLHCEMVRQAIESGVRHIDSMDGFYQYKQHWGAVFHHLQAVTVLSERLSSRVARGDFLQAYRIHHLCSRVWFWHVAPWLRQKYPNSQVSVLRNGLDSLYVRSRFLEYAADSCADDAICYLGAQ